MLEPLGNIFFSFYFEDLMSAGLFMPCSISVKSWISGRGEVKFCSSGQPLRRKRLWLLTLLKSLSFSCNRASFCCWIGSYKVSASPPLRLLDLFFVRSLNPSDARFILAFDRLHVALNRPPLRLERSFKISIGVSSDIRLSLSPLPLQMEEPFSLRCPILFDVRCEVF